MEVVFLNDLSKGKVSKLLELNATVLMKLNKDSLIDMIVDLVFFNSFLFWYLPRIYSIC
jgi:hypothetical protein